MVRVGRAAVGVMAVAILASGCGGGTALDTAESTETTIALLTPGEPTARPTFPGGSRLAEIQEDGVLTVGVPFDVLGYGQRDAEGRVEGFSVEIARLIAAGIFGGTTADLGGRLEFVSARAADAKPLLDDKRVDFVVAAGTLPQDGVEVAGPWVVHRQDVITVNDDLAADRDLEIRALTDLHGRRVCTIDGLPVQHLQMAVPGAQIAVGEDVERCGEEVERARFDALTGPQALLGRLAQRNPTIFHRLGATFGDEPWRLAARTGDAAMRDFLDIRLAAVFRTGAWANAYDDTLGVLGLETPTPPALDRPPVEKKPTTATTRPRGGSPTTRKTTSTTGRTTSTSGRSTTSTTELDPFPTTSTTEDPDGSTTTTSQPTTSTTILPRSEGEGG